jgi:ABC-2 type transport system permease protein
LRQLRLTLVVAGEDLRRRIRNRSALVMAFAGPLVLAAVFSLLVGGAGDAGIDLGVVDLDGSPTSQALVAGLVEDLGDASEGRIEVLVVHGDGAARDGVAGGDLDAALVLPAGFGAAATRGAPTDVGVIRHPDRAVSGQVAASLAAAIAAEFERVGLAVAVASSPGVVASPPGELLAAAQAQPPALALADLPVGGRELSAGAFYGAAMAILFLFFTVGFAARSILAERQAGTLARALATPVTPGALLAGKTLSVGVLGLAGFVTVWAVTSLLFDAPWGAPAAVLAVMVTTVFAIAGLATFVASLARSERQADAATGATTFVLALLGGNFVGPNLPPVLRRLSILTPNGWSLRAFTDLNTEAAGFAEIVPSLGVLTAMGVLFGGLGVVRIRRVMVP